MTTIGTRLASHATRVMFLGSGELGKELAIELMRYGCEVIAVDLGNLAVKSAQVSHWMCPGYRFIASVHSINCRPGVSL